MTGRLTEEEKFDFGGDTVLEATILNGHIHGVAAGFANFVLGGLLGPDEACDNDDPCDCYDYPGVDRKVRAHVLVAFFAWFVLRELEEVT